MHILLLQIYHIYCLHLADMCDNMSVVIRLQKLAMPATGRKTCGPSFFIPKFYGRIFMQKKLTKPFITYFEQLNNLIQKKHLNISNLSYAKNKLLNIGYYSLIDGYKDIFYNPMTRTYEKVQTLQILLPYTTSMKIFVRLFLNIFAILSKKSVR